MSPKDRYKALDKELERIVVQLLADPSHTEKVDIDLLDSIHKWRKQLSKRLMKIPDDPMI